MAPHHRIDRGITFEPFSRRRNDTETECYQEWIAQDRQLRITAQMGQVAAKATNLLREEAKKTCTEVQSQALGRRDDGATRQCPRSASTAPLERVRPAGLKRVRRVAIGIQFSLITGAAADRC
jgi:hypothetical protein